MFTVSALSDNEDTAEETEEEKPEIEASSKPLNLQEAKPKSETKPVKPVIVSASQEPLKLQTTAATGSVTSQNRMILVQSQPHTPAANSPSIIRPNQIMFPNHMFAHWSMKNQSNQLRPVSLKSTAPRAPATSVQVLRPGGQVRPLQLFKSKPRPTLVTPKTASVMQQITKQAKQDRTHAVQALQRMPLPKQTLNAALAGHNLNLKFEPVSAPVLGDDVSKSTDVLSSRIEQLIESNDKIVKSEKIEQLRPKQQRLLRQHSEMLPSPNNNTTTTPSTTTTYTASDQTSLLSRAKSVDEDALWGKSQQGGLPEVQGQNANVFELHDDTVQVDETAMQTAVLV